MLPVADVGLSAPQITELLPNPDGTGNDDTDEFIELYNPNTAEFHLVGFTLQTGSTTKHNYTFPDGTVLEPQSFTAFYSSDTGLSLSNTSGQADLLDPFGNLLGQTDAYGTAKDGQAWALASGVWYWTSQPTPNAANVVSQAAATAKSSKSTTAGKSSSGVKGASTSSNSASSSGSSSASDTTAPAPIHPFILVAVGVLAVGYGVYEYRHDLANIIHRFRRHRTAGRTARA
ncbi:MAG: lamin tail domain-containing protein [Candidatus Saccharibacteria bacterium]